MAVYDDEASANDGKAKCQKDTVLYTSKLIKVKEISDDSLRSKAADLKSTICSEVYKGSDGKYYAFRG
jgi:hypothetical protein